MHARSACTWPPSCSLRWSNQTCRRFRRRPRHPPQPALRSRHDARVVSIQHPPNSTLHTFQCRFMANFGRLFLQVHKIREYACLLAESLLYDDEYRSKEDIEQQRGKYASLTEPLCHLEPFRASAVIIPHACSHPIVELADHLYLLRRYSKASEHLPKKCAVD